MDAPAQLWEAWREQVKQLFPNLHGHQQKALAWAVLGVVLVSQRGLATRGRGLVRDPYSQDAQYRTSPGPLCR